MENEKNLFDEELELQPELVEKQTQEEFEYEELDESPEERAERIRLAGDKRIADGEILKIIDISYTKLITQDENGDKILPKKAVSSNVYYYTIKLKVLFENDKGERIVEYYPGVKVFTDSEGNIATNKNGKIVPILARPDVSESAVAKLFDLYSKFIKKPISKISDKEFRQGLVGRKVRIKTEKGKFAGQEWFRNDIVEIIE